MLGSRIEGSTTEMLLVICLLGNLSSLHMSFTCEKQPLHSILKFAPFIRPWLICEAIYDLVSLFVSFSLSLSLSVCPSLAISGISGDKIYSFFFFVDLHIANLWFHLCSHQH
jgi:hypothetical protein